jgi:hypothetical protein
LPQFAGALKAGDRIGTKDLLATRFSLALAAVLAPAALQPALADEINVAIESTSSFELEKVFVAPAGTNAWQRVPLHGLMATDPTIVPGGSGQIRVSAQAGNCVFDLHFLMDSGVEFFDRAVDLCAHRVYELTDRFE